MEIKAFYRTNANFEKHGCQNSVAMVTSMLKYTTTLKCFQISFRKSWWSQLERF